MKTKLRKISFLMLLSNDLLLYQSAMFSHTRYNCHFSSPVIFVQLFFSIFPDFPSKTFHCTGIGNCGMKCSTPFWQSRFTYGCLLQCVVGVIQCLWLLLDHPGPSPRLLLDIPLFLRVLGILWLWFYRTGFSYIL